MELESIKVKGIRNIRNITQFVNDEGKKIKENILIRSEKLNKLSKKRHKKFLDDYNIGTLIDLRTDLEVLESMPHQLPEHIEYHHIPVLSHTYFGITHEKKMRSVLFRESKKMDSDTYFYDYMANMYTTIIFEEYSRQQFKKFFDVLLKKDEGNVVFYCNGGKDRTGMASFFILSALGVSKEDILDDYSMSDYLNRKYNKAAHFFLKYFIPFKKFKKLLISMLYARREYLEKAINVIEEKYGSILNYLKVELGIDENKQEELKKIYLE